MCLIGLVVHIISWNTTCVPSVFFLAGWKLPLPTPPKGICFDLIDAMLMLETEHLWTGCALHAGSTSVSICSSLADFPLAWRPVGAERIGNDDTSDCRGMRAGAASGSNGPDVNSAGGGGESSSHSEGPCHAVELRLADALLSNDRAFSAFSPGERGMASAAPAGAASSANAAACRRAAARWASTSRSNEAARSPKAPRQWTGDADEPPSELALCGCPEASTMALARRPLAM
mmetsp:Transcript_69637/g.202075  ORF Transcript_69637/g.202075 Transcript_69637/m.202075 type:complete len:232 (-) Transcript_69637:86-781(-)